VEKSQCTEKYLLCELEVVSELATRTTMIYLDMNYNDQGSMAFDSAIVVKK
jgi:hypothetical protein